MGVLNHLYYWTDQVMFWGALALRVWAVVDCVTRKAGAFTAADKLTKPAWLAILLVSAALGTLFYSPLGPISLISVIASAVYLADVRPAVRAVSGGKSSW